MSDPRKGWPSASAMPRIMKCAASFLREKGLPEEESDVASEGTLLHKVLETGQGMDQLSSSQRWLVNECMTIEEDMTRSLGFPSDASYIEIESEKRLWLNDFEYVGPEMEDVNLSGQYDRRYLDKAGKRCVVIDYKTGRREVEHAVENKQLSALAALEFYDQSKNGLDLTEIYVMIIQPLVDPHYTIARFTPKVHRNSWGRMLNRIREANWPDAPAKAGEHCLYCKARGLCPEAREFALTILPEEQVEVITGSRGGITVAIPKLAPEDVLRVLPKISVARKILDAIYQQAKDLAAAGELPGYELTDGKNRIEFTNLMSAWKQLGRHLGLRKCLSLISIGVEKLDDAVVARFKIPKAQARDFWRNKLFGIAYTVPQAPELAKVKDKPKKEKK